MPDPFIERTSSTGPFFRPAGAHAEPTLGTSFLVAAFVGLVLFASGAGAAPANKCVVKGTVTFQQGPCPTDQVRKPPTVEELNAEEKRRRAAAATTALEKPSPRASDAAGGFGCDGRKYCSQMGSCAEARFFLAHCPGVKMDGDKNGIPCEKQWCAR